jgi:predicted TIM-barrel fold metal-dependent hydrolase
MLTYNLMRFAFVICLGCLCTYGQPAMDHHQHLLRSAVTPPDGFALTADDLIAQMDEAGIRRAVVLSIAYQFANPRRPPITDEYTRVKAENDWTREQAARYPRRLTAICAVNPLREYALAEIRRCAQDAGLRRGLKLHFGNSDVDLNERTHVIILRRVFREANRCRMAIVAHIRANTSRSWGAEQARVFLEEVLPSAPDIPVQIAHLTGPGGYEDPGIDAAVGVFADAIAARDKRMKRVYFDVSGVFLGQWESKADLIVRRLRMLGLDRILYGSDGPPAQNWKAFRKLPLSEEEFGTIERNIGPYLQ